MEYTTIQKNIQNSPRKLRLVADMVRKMTPTQAIDALSFSDRAAAIPFKKAIQTVMANAKAEENLTFKVIEINEGMKLKRYRAGTAGRGRGRPYKRRWAHIKIVLTDEVTKVPKVSKVSQVDRKEENSKHEARKTKQI